MILICVNPFLSHFLPTVPLAKGLRALGNKVIYVGFEATNTLAEQEKFKYITLVSCQDEEIQKQKKTHNYEQVEQKFRILHKEIEEKISTTGANLILFHISRFDIYFIPAFLSNVRIVTYDTCSGSICFNGRIPPTTCSFVPEIPWDIRNLWFWGKRYIRKVHDLKWKYLKKIYPYSEMRKISDEYQYEWKFCIDGFYLKFPHIKFSPNELEFKYYDDIFYAGLCTNSGSEEEIQELRPKKNRILIYCSLGTMSYRYKKTNKFFYALIDIMRKHPEIDLIISLGCKNAKLDVSWIPSNITVYDFVNQSSVLRISDLVITHGGAGTIKECIFNEVPMLVCPSSYDQHGNAARVYYHRIGLRNNLMRKNLYEKILKKDISNINTNLLEKQIIMLLNNPEYKKNISNMNKRIINTDELQRVVKYLNCISNENNEKEKNVREY